MYFYTERRYNYSGADFTGRLLVVCAVRRTYSIGNLAASLLGEIEMKIFVIKAPSFLRKVLRLFVKKDKK